jgi:predicted phage-related endonuclease
VTAIAIRNPEHWHDLRAGHVGGSEVAALFGVQPDYAMSHWTLWQVKSGRMAPPFVDSERPKWGRRLEAVIAEAVAEERGWHIHAMTDYHAKGRLGATLDFQAYERPELPGALEIKNADWLVHKRQWSDGEPPPHILLQLQTQLAVTGWQWGAVACLVGGNHLEIYRYDRRPKLIAEIEARVAAFWESIEAGKEPPIDGSDSTAAALKALFPEALDDEVDMSADNELPAACASYLHAAAARREAEKAEAAARNVIVAKLGDHGRAICEGFRVSAPAVPASPDKIITAAMVGTVVKGRSGYRRLNVKELT